MADGPGHPETPQETDEDLIKGVAAEIAKKAAEDVKADQLRQTADGALARAFAEINADRLRHVAARGKWFIYDGTHWRVDETREVFNEVAKFCHAVAEQCPARLAKTVDATHTVRAVEEHARGHDLLRADITQFDAEADLLNTPAGTVDLRTGTLREHRAEDYCTRITAAGPSDAVCPLWKAFLRTTTKGDTSFETYLQMIAGYALCGAPTEDQLFFLHGHGDNGKSVFLDTLGYVMGSYHMNAPSELLTLSYNERHPTEMARLQGARLVTLSEIEPGKKWAEARLKGLTGRDPITAHFMRKDDFTYQPQCVLMIAGNDKPSLHSVGKAIQRRMRLLPFTNEVPQAQRDTELRSKLQPEAGGILQWAIEGAKSWRRQKGLHMPVVVADATAEYLAAEDHIGEWIGDRCRAAPQAFTPSRVFVGDYRQWAEDEGKPAVTEKQLAAALASRGFARVRQRPPRSAARPPAPGAASRQQGNPRWGFRGIELAP